jgi:hypothetical protein
VGEHATQADDPGRVVKGEHPGEQHRQALRDDAETEQHLDPALSQQGPPAVVEGHRPALCGG